MTENKRRDFLKFAAGGAGMLAAYAGFPPAIRKALAIPAATRSGSIEDVGHIVILMQENRSFDHYFGSLSGVRGFNDPRPLLLPNGAPVWQQPPASTKTSRYQSRGLDPSASYVLPFYINPDKTTDHQPDTNHGWSSGHLAWNQGWWNQWVNQKQDVLTMGYLKRQDLQYHYALADAFTICDAYFASVHADTAPNRIYLWTGTIDTQNTHGSKNNGPGLSERSNTNGYTWTTYPERLQAQGIRWRVYQGGSGIPGTPTDNYTDNSLEFFAKYQTKAGASGPLVDNGASQHSLAQFKADVLSGQLPQVSWIVAPQQYCEHPSSSPTDGADYINMVLEALTSDPAVWAKTVLFVNYDENDGLFDHVVPPMPPIISEPNNQGMVSVSLSEDLGDETLDLDKYPSEMSPLIPGADPGGIQPVGLGVRVPMLIISPWTKGGWVCSEVFDHTSVLRFLEKRFNLPETNISQWRRSICGDLTSAFDFSASADPSAVHFTVPSSPICGGGSIQVPHPQSMPQQEPGTRPARPLGYAFEVNGQICADQSCLILTFTNTGQNGVAFYAYDRLQTSNAPRRYAVAAQDELLDSWDISTGSHYDFAIYGPNGYLCEFSGADASGSAAGERPSSDAPSENLSSSDSGDGAAPEARMYYEPDTRRILLAIHHRGHRPCRVTADNAYDSALPQEHLLSPGEDLTIGWDLAPEHGWYDLSMRAFTEKGGRHSFRRVAGHIETGRPSLSDPGPVKKPI